MEVYLSTLDYNSEENLRIIEEMFNKDKGKIKFKYLQANRNSQNIEEYEQLRKLSLEDIQKICGRIKGSNNIYNEYIVLVTKKSIEKPKPITLQGKESWYSAFEFKNIAVNSTGWEAITENRSYLAIAHQIIENLFQSLSHMNLNSQQLLQDVHIDSKGCINDYCRNKNEIHAKILSGFICKSCQERARIYMNDDSYLIQIKNILTRIRNRITDNFEFQSNGDIDIVVDKYGEITVGKNKLNFGKSTNVKRAYLFYIINFNKPIGVEDFLKNKDIQNKFTGLSRITGEYSTLHKMGMYIKGISTYHSRSKRYLLNSIMNEGLVEYFMFKTKKNKDTSHYYMIEVNESKITIDESLLKFRIN